MFGVEYEYIGDEIEIYLDYSEMGYVVAVSFEEALEKVREYLYENIKTLGNYTDWGWEISYVESVEKIPLILE